MQVCWFYVVRLLLLNFLFLPFRALPLLLALRKAGHCSAFTLFPSRKVAAPREHCFLQIFEVFTATGNAAVMYDIELELPWYFHMNF